MEFADALHLTSKPPNYIEQCLNRGIVTERLADMRVELPITRPEYETASELERILAQRMLTVTFCASSRSRSGIIAPQQVQHIRGF